MIKSTLIGVAFLLGVIGGICALAFASFYAFGFVLWRLGFVTPEHIIPAGIQCFFVLLLLVTLIIGGYQLGDGWRRRKP